MDNARVTTVGDLKAAAAAGRPVRDALLRGADVRAAALDGLRADGLDLEDADLREASLARARWRACVMRDARLDDADLSASVLRMCNLDHARVERANLRGARLENCTARGARFDGADFTGAHLTDSDLSRASLRAATLAGVSASGTDLRGADLRDAVLSNAVLVDADLRGADLTGARLDGADLRGADVRGVTGLPPALIGDGSASELPATLQPLAETLGPIVAEVLRTAGAGGGLDADAAATLLNEAATLRAPSPRHAPHAETMAAVGRVIGQLDADSLPALMAALRQPGGSEPPPQAKALIAKLRHALGLPVGATAEDVLARLTPGKD